MTNGKEINEKELLLSIVDQLDPDRHLEWFRSIPLDEWPGILVRRGRVIEIDLYHCELSGTIPAELGQFTELEYLHLGCNMLTGQIPTELGQLTNLEWLDLGWNQLTGPIPPQLGKLSRLKVLDLNNNELTGPIPHTLGNLPRLEILWLHENLLSGTIPLELGQLPRIQELFIAENEVTGDLPPFHETSRIVKTDWPQPNYEPWEGYETSLEDRSRDVQSIAPPGNTACGPLIHQPFHPAPR